MGRINKYNDKILLEIYNTSLYGAILNSGGIYNAKAGKEK